MIVCILGCRGGGGFQPPFFKTITVVNFIQSHIKTMCSHIRPKQHGMDNIENHCVTIALVGNGQYRELPTVMVSIEASEEAKHRTAVIADCRV